MADSTVNATSDFINQMNAVSSSSRKSDQSLSMDDFFQLMVAQLQNQDMFNPTDNSEMVSQMAQFSMVNALSDLQELSSVTYSMSLIGKQATVAYMKDGQMYSDSGVISGVNLFNGSAEVLIGQNSYGIANVMSITDTAKAGSESSLISNAGLIGMYATAMQTTDEGVETVRGVIEMLRLVDDEVKAYIGGKAFSLRELSALSVNEEEPEAAQEESNP
jgi:flagellar basal-body rod modification protein FlgD